MNQAILITAYHQLDHIFEIIDSFDDQFKIYIHVDKEVIITNEWKEKCSSYNHVRYYQKYNTYWGSHNHLRAITFLMQESFQNSRIGYFHLISGQDYPIKSSASFVTQFNLTKAGYINWFEIKGSAYETEWMSRLNYRGLYNVFNVKHGWFRKINNLLLWLQIKLNMKRHLKTNLKLYGGIGWWSLRRDCVDYVLKFVRDDKILWPSLKNTFCPEEFYVHTVLLNSYLATQLTNNNLRFCDWRYVNGNNPANLDLSYANKILASDAFFARRFHYPIAIELIKYLKQNINKL